MSHCFKCKNLKKEEEEDEKGSRWKRQNKEEEEDGVGRELRKGTGGKDRERREEK